MPTFYEGHELVGFDSVALQANLECQEEGVKELMLLIQAPDLVLPHFVCEVVDDVLNPLRCYRGLLRSTGGVGVIGRGGVRGRGWGLL